MMQSMEFLSMKYTCRPVFVTDLTLGDRGVCYQPLGSSGRDVDLTKIFAALTTIHEKAMVERVCRGTEFQLPPTSYVQGVVVLEGTQEEEAKENFGEKIFRVLTQPPGARKSTVTAPKVVKGGVFVDFNNAPTEKVVEEFFRDADRFVENWTIAYSVLCLLQDTSDERARRKKAERGI
jgi:hypothetical protein